MVKYPTESLLWTIMAGKELEKTQNNKPQTNMSTYQIYISLKENHNFPTQKTGAIPTRVFLLNLSEGFFAKFLPFHLGKFLTFVPKPEFLATFLEIPWP